MRVLFVSKNDASGLSAAATYAEDFLGACNTKKKSVVCVCVYVCVYVCVFVLVCANL